MTTPILLRQTAEDKAASPSVKDWLTLDQVLDVLQIRNWLSIELTGMETDGSNELRIDPRRLEAVRYELGQKWPSYRAWTEEGEVLAAGFHRMTTTADRLGLKANGRQGECAIVFERSHETTPPDNSFAVLLRHGGDAHVVAIDDEYPFDQRSDEYIGEVVAYQKG